MAQVGLDGSGTPEYPALVIRVAVPLDPTEHLLHSSPTKHVEKNIESAKLRKQRDNSQMKKQNKTPEKELNKKETSAVLEAEFPTVLEDAQGTQCAPQLHKKGRERDEECAS